MNVPPRVDAVLGGEDVAAHVPLKGEDALFVTPTRTLHYTAEGLLSDESVTEYDNNAERIEVREGRRKSKIVLDYGLDGDAELPVPGGKINDALHPILAGVLNAAGVSEVGETVKRTYRFSELTLVVTSHRIVKHIGNAVWDEEFEEIPFTDVTGLGVEEGNVASQLVLETTGRTQRIKAPNEEFRDVHETIEDVLFAFHDVSTAAEFEQAVGGDEEEAEPTGSGEVSFDSEPKLEVDSGSTVTDSVEALGEPEPVESSPATEDARGAASTGSESVSAGSEPDSSAPGSVSTGNSGGGAATGTESTSPGSDSRQRTETEPDALAQSGFEKASAKVPPQVDVAAVRVQLDAIDAELAEQESAIVAQRERIDAIRDLLPDE